MVTARYATSASVTTAVWALAMLACSSTAPAGTSAVTDSAAQTDTAAATIADTAATAPPTAKGDTAPDAGPPEDAGRASDAVVVPDAVTHTVTDAATAPDAPPEQLPETTDVPPTPDVAAAVDSMAAPDSAAQAEVEAVAADSAPPSADSIPASTDTVVASDVTATAVPVPVTFVLTGATAGMGGMVKVVAVSPLYDGLTPGGTGGDPFSDNPTVATGSLTLPGQLSGTILPGTWKFAAAIIGPQGFPVAGGITCAEGAAAAVVISADEVNTLPMLLEPMTGPSSLSKLCQSSATGPPQGFLTNLDVLLTPATAEGAAHFMHALTWQNRVWIAGSQDGLVSFDFAPDANAAKPVNNWTVYGGQMCNRLLRDGSTLYCSSRNAYVQVAALGPAKNVISITKQWLQTSGTLGTEGMAMLDGQLYIAAFGQGMVRTSALATAKPLVIAGPANSELWDIAPLPPNRLLVGGGGGLWVFDAAKLQVGAPPWVAALPLPGVAAHLHVAGPLAYVGDLNGAVHVVDVSDPLQAKLVASRQVPESVFGITSQAGLIWAAAGHHLLALQLAAGPTLVVKAASPALRYAQDVQPLGSDALVVAEFQDVRRVHIEISKLPNGPVLVTHPIVAAAVVAVGAKIASTLRLHNVGPKPLTVSKLQFAEGKLSLPVDLAGPWQVPANQSILLPFAFTKTVKGGTEHKLLVHSDAAGAPVTTVTVVPTTWPLPGDILPKLVYQGLAGPPVDVQAQFAGKVGVLLVVAQSCPVALMAMAAAGRDLAPLLATGKVAAVALNPWDKAGAPELPLVSLPFAMLHTPLTTTDSKDYSEVLDTTLGQPSPFGPPMPIVYVVDKAGKIVLAQWGYDPGGVLAAVAVALGTGAP